MRISELSETSGVPVPTIKFYLREGLLHAGEKITPRLTEYDETHRRRLGLLRILREVGDVPVDRLGLLVATTQSRHSSVHEMLAAASDALAPEPAPPGPGAGRRTRGGRRPDRPGRLEQRPPGLRRPGQPRVGPRGDRALPRPTARTRPG